jgi:TonB family protein
MTESPPASTAEAKSQPDKPSTIRLVIRAEIIPDEPAPTVVPQSSLKRVLAVIAGAIAVLALIGIGISVFKPEPASAPVASEGAQKSEPSSESVPVIGTVPPPATSPAETKSTLAKASEPEMRDEPAALLSPINEVLPTPSRSALQTIRGTIRVSVRVSIDKQGKVTAATPEDPGPSRYFERQSVEAAKKWTFAPVDSDEYRTMLLRFHFTREGATAHADT